MNRIILIGGAPTLGKTTIAKKLSKELKIPWISTDTIREMMVKIVDPQKYPNLYNFPKSITAEKYLSTHTPKQMAQEEIAESQDVWRGIKALVETDEDWESFIVEGVAILPSLVKKLMKSDKRIKPVFLTSDNEDKFRKVIYTRGLWTDADKYSDDVKEVEVKWAMIFNEYIKREAKKYSLPVIDVSQKIDISETKRIIKI